MRFVVRLRMMARAWRKQEQLRKTLLAKFEEQEALDAQSEDAPSPQPMPNKPVSMASRPKSVTAVSQQHQKQQMKVKHIEQLQHLRFGSAMSVDLEASSSTAREDQIGSDADHHNHHHHHHDVGADSAAEMWMSGDEEMDGLWRREDFAAPPPPPPRVDDEGLDGTEAISVDSD